MLNAAELGRIEKRLCERPIGIRSASDREMARMLLDDLVQARDLVGRLRKQILAGRWEGDGREELAAEAAKWED